MWWESAGLSMILIALAEIGDKSQLVCMALAARHGRVWPVLFGALLAFGILNGIAVLFGAALAAWLPQSWLLAAMALLFAGFGLHALMQGADEDEAPGITRTGHGLLITTFLLILVAEMGDKTQIAVAALSGIHPPVAVWLGATAALAGTSLLGAVAGKTVLNRLPIVWLHRGAGALFLALAAWSVWRLVAS